MSQIIAALLFKSAHSHYGRTLNGTERGLHAKREERMERTDLLIYK
jgi:hypothetical protein